MAHEIYDIVVFGWALIATALALVSSRSLRIERRARQYFALAFIETCRNRLERRSAMPATKS